MCSSNIGFVLIEVLLLSYFLYGVMGANPLLTPSYSNNELDPSTLYSRDFLLSDFSPLEQDNTERSVRIEFSGLPDFLDWEPLIGFVLSWNSDVTSGGGGTYNAPLVRMGETHIYYRGATYKIEVWDFSAGYASPVLADTVATSERVYALCLDEVNHMMIVLDGWDMDLANVSDPLDLHFIGTSYYLGDSHYSFGGALSMPYSYNGYYYQDKAMIMDWSDVDTPTERGSGVDVISDDAGSPDIYIDGGVTYIVVPHWNKGFITYDVTNPDIFDEKSLVANSDEGDALTATFFGFHDGMPIVLYGFTNKIQIMNYTDPTDPSFLYEVGISGHRFGLNNITSPTFVGVASGGGVGILDMKDPSRVRYQGFSDHGEGCENVCIMGSYIICSDASYMHTYQFGSVRLSGTPPPEFVCGSFEITVHGEDVRYGDTVSTNYYINMTGTCQNGGVCIESIHECNCSLANGYYGDLCHEWNCHGINSTDTDIVCSGRGECISPDSCACNDGVVSSNHAYSDNCSCHENYYGEFCNTTFCHGILSNNTENVCSGNGECSLFDICDCGTDYYGMVCNITTCHGVFSNESSVCYDHGTCVDIDRCECDEGYFGEFCNITTCYGLYNNVTEVCSTHGLCEFEDQCDCDDNYFGVFCNVTTCYGNWNNFSADCNEVCSRHGDCEIYDHCDCDDDYYGLECNITMCNGIFNNISGVFSRDSDYPCSDHGTCFIHEHCDCDENYFGTSCNVTTCFDVFTNTSDPSELCAGRGECLSHDDCKCNPGVNNPLEDCGCVDGLFGSNCTVFYCFGIDSNTSEVCSSYGDCIGHDTCFCDEEYYGIYCNITTCDGVFSNVTDPSKICHGHGTCDIDRRECDCVEPDTYSGPFCGSWECFEKERDLDSVCSTRGVCWDFNECNCSNPYYGIACEEFSCYGWNRYSLEEVCGGHGACVSPDNCLCSVGYGSFFVGGPCVTWQCYGLDWNDSSVCSEKGECVNAYDCKCDEGYEGDKCDSWSCGGVDYKLVGTCNGKGTCSSPELCECSGLYRGELCDKNLALSVVMAPILSVAGVVAGMFLLLGIACLVCFCCFLLVFCCVVTGYLFLTNTRQKSGIKKFSKLKNFDLLLREQEMEEDTSTANLKINNTLFEIPFDEIKTISILGEGGSSSVVFKASWNGKIVGFKCFKTRTLMSSQDKYDEFEREVEILGSLSFPFIIRFYGATLKHPRVGIVMEFASNGEILEYINKFRELGGQQYPLHQKIRMLWEISSAMGFLHARNIIHRDLKSENVLVDSKEETKLMDFGLSRLVERMSTMKTLRVGTSVYMAPEIINDSNYTEKCDVFSFSILVYVVLNENSSPYVGQDEFKIEFKVCNDPAFRPDLTALNIFGSGEDEEENEWLRDLMTNAWEHKPGDRRSFQQISEILEKKKMDLEGGSVSKLFGSEKVRNDKKETKKDEEEEDSSGDDDDMTQVEMKSLLREMKRENEELRKKVEKAKVEGFVV